MGRAEVGLGPQQAFTVWFHEFVSTSAPGGVDRRAVATADDSGAGRWDVPGRGAEMVLVLPWLSESRGR